MRAQWIQAAKAQGWRQAPSDGRTICLVCARQGCSGKISVPIENLGPIPDPCQLPHAGQYAGPVFETYQALVSELARRRRSLGLSQEDVAAAGGFADGHINKLEALDRIAQMPTLQLWAQTVGCQITLQPCALPPATHRAIERRPAPLRQTNKQKALFDDR